MATTLLITHRRDAALLEQIEGSAGRTFALRRAREVVGSLDQTDVRRLLRNGWVRRVGRGHYTITSRPQVESDTRLRLATAPFAEEPHYVSWWAALSYHRLTEQDPLRIGVAVGRRHRDRRVGPLRVNPVMQSAERFYGFETVRLEGGGSLCVATPEKAIIDSLDRPDLGGGLREVVKALSTGWGYNAAKLVCLTRQHPSEALIARLGYLLTVLGIDGAADLQDKIRRRRPPVLLDVEANAEGGHVDPTWRIHDTIGPAAICAWGAV